MARHSARTGLPTKKNSPESDHLWRSYDVISILQNGSHIVRNLLPVVSLVTASRSICLPNFDEISHLTAEILLLPVYKTNGRHIIILPA